MPQQGLEFFVEDGFKLLGIATGLLYFSRTALAQIQDLIDEARFAEAIGHLGTKAGDAAWNPIPEETDKPLDTMTADSKATSRHREHAGI